MEDIKDSSFQHHPSLPQSSDAESSGTAREQSVQELESAFLEEVKQKRQLLGMDTLPLELSSREGTSGDNSKKLFEKQ